MIPRLAVIAILVVLSVCLVTGIRVLMNDGWTRIAWAVVKLSEAAPKAAEGVAKAGDVVASWLLVRSIKDAPASDLGQGGPDAGPPFGPAPRPEGPDPAAARSGDPSPAELTSFDEPIAPERPYVERRPFGAAVAAAMTMTRSRP